MALIVVFRNISELADVSDYVAEVYVNHTQIAGPVMVKGHTREHGWEALVKQWAEGLQINPFKPKVLRRASEANARDKAVRSNLPRGE